MVQTTSDYTYCASRLPCGICRLTNTDCPKLYFSTTITCNPCSGETDSVMTTSTTWGTTKMKGEPK